MTENKTQLTGRNIIDLMETNSQKFVADLVKVTPKTIRDRLQKVGYTPQKQGVGKPTKWTWEHEGEEPNAILFECEVEVEQVEKEEEVQVKQSEGEEEVKVNSPTVHTQFTQADIQAIVQETVKAMQQTATTTEQDTEQATEQENIYERDRVLPMDNKTRKTIVINEGISIALDQFCHNKKLNKSDVIHLALKELLLKEGAEI